MFFETATAARLQASIETKELGTHISVPCKKYLCPPNEYFGRDFINGFTLVLAVREKARRK